MTRRAHIKFNISCELGAAHFTGVVDYRPLTFAGAPVDSLGEDNLFLTVVTHACVIYATDCGAIDFVHESFTSINDI